MTRSASLTALVVFGLVTALAGHAWATLTAQTPELISLAVLAVGLVVLAGALFAGHRHVAIAGAIVAVGGLALGARFPVELATRGSLLAAAGGLLIVFEAGETQRRFDAMTPPPTKAVQRGIVRGLVMRVTVVLALAAFVLFAPVLLAPVLPELVAKSLEIRSAWGIVLQGAVIALALLVYGGLTRIEREDAEPA